MSVSWQEDRLPLHLILDMLKSYYVDEVAKDPPLRYHNVRDIVKIIEIVEGEIES